jgi:hypothetical protein
VKGINKLLKTIGRGIGTVFPFLPKRLAEGERDAKLVAADGDGQARLLLAKVEAEARRIEATGIADANEIIAVGEARIDALRQMTRDDIEKLIAKPAGGYASTTADRRECGGCDADRNVASRSVRARRKARTYGSSTSPGESGIGFSGGCEGYFGSRDSKY